MDFFEEPATVRLRQPEDHGRWEGTTFTFTPAITVMGLDGPAPMRTVDLARAIHEYGIEPREVILALLNPSERPYERELREIALGR